MKGHSKKEKEKHKFEFLVIGHLKKIIQFERQQEISEYVQPKQKEELEDYLQKNLFAQDVFYPIRHPELVTKQD